MISKVLRNNTAVFVYETCNKVRMDKDMDKIFEQTLLYDFYGELLTDHQQNIYEQAISNDMSLSEIAEEQGISRQGVHDLIKRCDKSLQVYESKLQLVAKFTDAKMKISEIVALTQIATESDEIDSEQLYKDIDERMKRIRELSQNLLKDW